MDLNNGIALVALAVISGTCAMLVAGPRWLAVWCIVVAYVTWPAFWLAVKQVGDPGVLMPFPRGKVFPNPELLGVNLTGGWLHTLKTRVARWFAWFVEIGPGSSSAGSGTSTPRRPPGRASCSPPGGTTRSSPTGHDGPAWIDEAA